MSVEIAAEAVCYIIFSVGHSARAAEAVHYRAGLAMYAGGYLFSVYRTDAAFYRTAAVYHTYFYASSELCKFVSHEYTARAGAYYRNIIFFHSITPLF